MNSIIILGVVLLCTAAVFIRASKKCRKLPLLPSPPADPLIGHLRIFPDTQVIGETFHAWSLKYGDIFSLRVPGKTIVVLNTEKAAYDLLEKRSAIYSDRIPIGYHDAIGWSDGIIHAPYGPFHNQQRKMYHDTLGKNVVSEYRTIQEREANTLLQGLLDKPKDFDRHALRFSGGIIAEVGYGHRIDSFDDEFFSIGERFLKFSNAATTPSLLDLHPAFAYLPSWAPGAWFVEFIKETKPVTDTIIHDNYQKVVDQMKAGMARPSFIATHLEAMHGRERDPEKERALKLAAGMIFAAGFETTWHTVTILIAALLLHPEVQQRAQKEIDEVIGRNRLPDLNDRESLPYVQCVINEVSRWQPVVPVGVPHRLMVDDIYNGMFIPKGSIIVANTRGMTWDEKRFHDPQQFKPERFLPKPEGAGEVFPMHAVFGWGRRICPGQHLAEGSFWTAATRILAVFTIAPMKDAMGKAVKLDIEFESVLIRHPKPFKCDIRPRDERARKLILDSCQD
ncbi:cytochrome P450 [Irpex rosettiformis]|uniref:Cytochrome P450 n=1 Tax=Irpex rosettiformis TaxID=378272 RepID=A0ACB8UH43_9APHY|nr:cytochrome P450 [Irpex rosettiformis]